MHDATNSLSVDEQNLLQAIVQQAKANMAEQEQAPSMNGN